MQPPKETRMHPTQEDDNFKNMLRAVVWPDESDMAAARQAAEETLRSSAPIARGNARAWFAWSVAAAALLTASWMLFPPSFTDTRPNDSTDASSVRDAFLILWADAKNQQALVQHLGDFQLSRITPGDALGNATLVAVDGDALTVTDGSDSQRVIRIETHNATVRDGIGRELQALHAAARAGSLAEVQSSRLRELSWIAEGTLAQFTDSDSAGAAARLSQLARDSTAENSRYALTSLSSLGTPEALRSLAALAINAPPDRAESALRILLRQDPRRIATHLEIIARSAGSPSVRSEAAAALASISPRPQESIDER